MKQLPTTVTAYRRTPQFTHETVPQGLLSNHNTKAGVWGMIVVESGQLDYIIENKETHHLVPGKLGIVEPEIIHHITPVGDVLFYVEFYK